MQYCPHCGAENIDSAKFCTACGRSLTTPAQIASVGPAASGAAPYSSPVPPPISRQPTLALQSLLHGRYLVHKLLAQRGIGAVYLAEDTQVFNRLCVVKEMLPYFTTPAERQQAEQNFEREARLLANLRHPDVPQLYDYFIAGWDRISALMPTVLQIARRRLFGAGFNPGTLSKRLDLPQIKLPGVATLGRWRAALTSLTLAELSAEMTSSLAFGATGTAVITQYVLANLVVELLIGIRLVLFRVLLIVLFLIALVLVVRYIREHH